MHDIRFLYLSFWSNSSKIFAFKHGTYAIGPGLTSSPPLGNGYVSGTASALISVVTNSFARSRCFASLAIETPISASHLVVSTQVIVYIFQIEY